MQRYDSYKDSGVKWLGEIPSHWEICKSKYLWEENVSLSANGYEELLSVSQYDGVTPAKGDSRSESLKCYKIVSEDDLVINIMLAWLGGLGVSKYNGIVSPAYCVYKMIGDANPRFLHFLYKTPLYLAEFARHSTGVVPSRWRMYSDDFGQVLTLLPPINEQDAIANYLDTATSKIDEAIAQQQKMIDLLNERKQIIINNAVTKGLDPYVKMKPSGIDWIGDIPVHWEVKKIKYIANVKGRIGFKGYSASDLVEEGAYSLGGKHITNNIVDLTEPTFLSWKKYYESPEIMIKKGDIVTAQRGSLGHTAIIEEDIGPATINPSLVLITNIKCYNKYLYWYLLSYPILKTIEVLNTATAVPMLSQKQIENMTIAMPSYKEQELISAYLEKETKKIEVSKDNINKQISLLQERKQIIINDVVTGKVKVI